MCVLALLAGWSAVVTRPITVIAAESDDAAQFVTLINQLRTSKGLPPLQIHSELVGPAQSWAQQLAVNGELSHASDLSVGVTVYWTKLGENVGVGPQGQVQQLFGAFVNSPGHYQNLVDPQFAYIGVGVVYADGHIWTAHRFMATGEAPTTAPPTTAPPATAPPTTAAPTTAAPTTVPTTAAPSTNPEPTAPTTSGPPDELLFADTDLDAPTVAGTADSLSDSGI